MTDTQVKYQQFVEDQRHNLAAERLGQQEVEAKLREVALKELKAPSEIEKMKAETTLDKQQRWLRLGSAINEGISSQTGSAANIAKAVESGSKTLKNVFSLFPNSLFS